TAVAAAPRTGSTGEDVVKGGRETASCRAPAGGPVIGGEAGSAARDALARARHAQVVHHVAHAAAGVGHVLDAMAHPALLDAALERDDAFADLDGDVARIDLVVLGEPLRQVL